MDASDHHIRFAERRGDFDADSHSNRNAHPYGKRNSYTDPYGNRNGDAHTAPYEPLDYQDIFRKED